MKKHYSLFSKSWARVGLVTAISIFPYLGLQAQTAPAKLWDKTIGASGNDGLSILKQTTDGGYILGGGSDSGINGDKSQVSKGGNDYWVVKTDASGTKAWDKTFGGSTDESFRTMIQTADGGYILGGYSNSGLSGDKSQASKGGYDYWIVKVDGSGNKVWDKTFGGSADEKLFSVQQTADGGYILGGASASGISGDKSQASQGLGDYWVVKLDASGNKTWDKTFGGSALDEMISLQQTADGGYILAGVSASPISGDKSQASKGLVDFWVIKIDATGTKSWDKTLGGSTDDNGYINIQQTTDGGYVLSGSSASPISGDKTEASKGGADFWVVKLDAAGTKTWDKTLGGSAADNPRSLQQTADGGYVLGGTSASGLSGDKSEANKGTTNVNDYWVVKLNASGTKIWDKTLGTSGNEAFNSLRQTSDGGFIVGGYSDSGINGDKSQATKGGNDYWVVKLAAANPLVSNDVAVTAITSVNSGCGLTNQETITITVTNYGTSPQSNIPVSYSVNGAVIGTGTIPGPVAPGSNATYTFTTKANLSALGAYSIEAKTNLTGDALPTNDAITKVVTAYSTPNTPTITASGSAALCTGGSVALTAASTSTGVTYQWFNNGVAIANATSATYNANSAGSYTATAVVAGNCSSPSSAATTLTMNTTPATPSISAGGPLAICNGGSVTLAAVILTPGVTFTWFKNGNVISGATGSTYSATTAGSYTVATSMNGCGSPASPASVVTIKAAPATPTVTQAGSVLTSSATTGNQWYKNAVLIPGQTNRTYTATSNGAYTVVVTSNGCGSLPSTAVNITTLGLEEEVRGLNATVYPNPSNGLFNISLPKGKGYELTITDLSGKVILMQKASEAKAQVNLSKAAKGIYLLKIVGEGKTATRKLVIE